MQSSLPPIRPFRFGLADVLAAEFEGLEPVKRSEHGYWLYEINDNAEFLSMNNFLTQRVVLDGDRVASEEIQWFAWCSRYGRDDCDDCEEVQRSRSIPETNLDPQLSTDVESYPQML